MCANVQRFCSGLPVSWFNDVQTVYKDSAKQYAIGLRRRPSPTGAAAASGVRNSARSLARLPLRFDLVVASSSLSDTADETEQMVKARRPTPPTLPRVADALTQMGRFPLCATTLQ